VRFMLDNFIIPGAGDVANMLSYLNPLRPVTAQLNVVAPIANPLNFTITGLSPNNAATKAAVTVALSDLIAAESTPGGTYESAGALIPGGTILWSHLNDAIGTAAGVNDFTLTTPAANVTNTPGYITTMGIITWD